MTRNIRYPYAELGAAAVRSRLGNISGVQTEDLVAALTFDDGPHPEFTPLLLEVLQKHRARATFFMVGQAAQRYPDLVRQVARSGHVIGNHSWDHPSFRSISARERKRQLRACAKAIAPYGRRLFRPPYGHQTPASLSHVVSMRYASIKWSLHAEDWLEQKADDLFGRLVKGIHPGCVILLHDGLRPPHNPAAANRRPVIRAVEMLLETVGEQFRFVTIPELLQCGRLVLR